MRHGVKIVSFNAQRRYANKTHDLAQITKEEHKSVITIGDKCQSFTLSKELIDAVKSAEDAYTNRVNTRA